MTNTYSISLKTKLVNGNCFYALNRGFSKFIKIQTSNDYQKNILDLGLTYFFKFQ